MANSYLDDLDLPPSEDESEDEPCSKDESEGRRANGPFLRFKTAQVSWPRIRFVYTVCDEVEIQSECFLPQEIASQGPPADMEAWQKLQCAALNVGLVVLSWYWMACGHKRVVVSAGYLDAGQVAWWQRFYTHCFGEFAVVNGFTEQQVCVSLEVDAPSQTPPTQPDIPAACPPGRDAKVLCLLGGGKDSLVVHQVLREAGVEALTWLYVEGGRQEFEGSWRLQEIVQRSGSPALVMTHDFQNESLAKLRRSHRLHPCGHPWAALVGFDAVLVALLYGFDYVVVGNERSANYGNGISIGSLEVNHQFDKSFEFESRMHLYVRQHVAPRVYYFSALQHLWEVQIAWLFCQRSAMFLDVFISCNNSDALNEWCGDCDKCCFVFALLAAWEPPGNLAKQFGKNLFENPKLLQNFQNLLGSSSCESLNDNQSTQKSLARTRLKPFECVGTQEEVELSLWLAREASRASPEGLPLALASLALQKGEAHLGLLYDYNPRNLLPEWLRPCATGELLHEDVEDHGLCPLECAWKAFWNRAMSEHAAGWRRARTGNNAACKRQQAIMEPRRPAEVLQGRSVQELRMPSILQRRI